MHLHILGICGTFMGGVAQLAHALGHRVTGTDENVYPPMSTLLEAQGIEIWQGHQPRYLDLAPDQVIIGNVMRRGHPAVEQVLNQGLDYTSGPQWLAEHLLKQRWVLAVSGTHGKTTTASMLAWILDYAGLKPGFLIGGVAENFGVSARLGKTPFFVIEADEYDTAFFDKRAKFVHYRPRTLILNNLEYDHADIFPDLAAIERQFHHLVRTVPGQGLLITHAADAALKRVLEQGCWTQVSHFGLDHIAEQGLSAKLLQPDGQRFELYMDGRAVGQVNWRHFGRHNVSNALAAIAAARHAGVAIHVALEALGEFAGVKRRMQLRAHIDGISVYDDFAHHPTAIALTIEALRARILPNERILAVLEPRSNTMRMGIHQASLTASLQGADQVFVYAPPTLAWDPSEVIKPLKNKAMTLDSIDDLLTVLLNAAKAGDHLLIMSNGGFANLHQRFIDAKTNG